MKYQGFKQKLKPIRYTFFKRVIVHRNFSIVRIDAIIRYIIDEGMQNAKIYDD